MGIYRKQVLHTIILFVLIVFCFSATLSAASNSATLPPRVRVILAKISPLMAKKEYPKAEKILTTFLNKKSPKKDTKYHYPELYFALGNCYLLQEEYPEAAQAYREILTHDPGHTHAWLNLAKTCYEMKQFKEAAVCFEKGYESDKNKQPETLYYSAAAYLMEGEYTLSIVVFARLQASHPQAFKPEWKEYYVHALLGANQIKPALPLINELIGFYSDDKKIRWQEILLHQYLQLGMHDEALKYVNTLVEQNPQVANWWKALTHIQLGNNRYEEALAALIIYGYQVSLNSVETKLLADLFLQTGIPVKAVPVYASSMQKEQEGEILYRLALSHYQLGEPEEALNVIHHFKQHADNYQILMLQGELYYRLHSYGEAQTCFRQAADMDDLRNGQAWLMAGYAAMQMDDFVSGRNAFMKACRCAKEKKTATAALQQLEQIVMAHSTNSLR